MMMRDTERRSASSKIGSGDELSIIEVICIFQAFFILSPDQKKLYKENRTIYTVVGEVE